MSHDTSWQYLVSMPFQKGVVQECVTHLWSSFFEKIVLHKCCVMMNLKTGLESSLWCAFGFEGDEVSAFYISIGERCRCFFSFYIPLTSCTECCNDFGFGDQGLNLNDTHYDMYERAVTFEGPDFHSEASHIIFWLYDMLYTCTILHPKSMQ